MSELLCVKPKEKTILKVKDWKYKKDNPEPFNWTNSGNSSTAIGYEALRQGITGDGRNVGGYEALRQGITGGGRNVGGYYGSLHTNSPTEQSISLKPDKQ